jgi:alkylhydroperoxidase family enzyme
MPLLSQVPRAEVTSPIVATMYERIFGDRDPVAEPGTATGSPGTWWTVYAHSPDIMEHATRGFAMMRGSSWAVSGEVRELGRLRAGWLIGSQFVYSQHCKAGRSVGLSDEKIDAVPHWSTATCYDDRERTFLAFTDALVAQQGRVPDALGAALRACATDTEILEFAYSTMTYALHATICRGLRLEFDDVDDRIVEVPAPDGFEMGDVNAMISLPKS